MTAFALQYTRATDLLKSLMVHCPTNQHHNLITLLGG
jgi:hypothetical protein